MGDRKRTRKVLRKPRRDDRVRGHTASTPEREGSGLVAYPIRELLLPRECYKPRRDLIPRGIVVHGLSAINTNPSDPYDLEACMRILRDFRFSYHYAIERNGGVVRMVPESRPAKHAGVSRWVGHEQLGYCNQWTIGVTLLGLFPPFGDMDYTDQQIESLIGLSAGIMRRHKMPRHMITGHMDIAPDEVRGEGKGKTDPGADFPWDEVRGMLAEG